MKMVSALGLLLLRLQWYLNIVQGGGDGDKFSVFYPQLLSCWIVYLYTRGPIPLFSYTCLYSTTLELFRNI